MGSVSHAERRRLHAVLCAEVQHAVRNMGPHVVWAEAIRERPLIVGQLSDGRAFALAVKLPGVDLDNALRAFLLSVETNHGCGFVVRSVDDCRVWIKGLCL